MEYPEKISFLMILEASIMRIALCQIDPIVGSLELNQQKILIGIQRAKKEGADIVVFSEMALIGYPPEDLLLLPSFIQTAQEMLFDLIKYTEGIIAIVGTVRENPLIAEKGLFNSAAILENKSLVGYQDKSLLPDYDVFSERRYFEPGTASRVWNLKSKKIGITICEDLWQHAHEVGYSHYPRDPVMELQKEAPDCVINLSSSPFYLDRQKVRYKVCSMAAKTLRCPVLLCNQVGGNDSLIFDGHSMAVDAQGKLIHMLKGFEEDFSVIQTELEGQKFLPQVDLIQDLFQALVLGVGDYFRKLGFKKACLGLSGGIDSAVVACIAKEALGKENLLTLALPSRYSSQESLQDAKELCKHLEIPLKEISIEDPFETFLHLLEPHFSDHPFDHTEENIQSRIRGIILMAFSNKFGYLVLSTGNKSEMAMGYTTLYGDMCGGLAVLSDVNKDQVYKLAHFINRNKEIIPRSILEKPPSAELRPDQKDTDSLPEYSIVDKVLLDYVEEHCSPEEIAAKHGLSLDLVFDLIHRIHQHEYKRRQSPPGLRVSKKAFSVGRRFPIVQHWNMI